MQHQRDLVDVARIGGVDHGIDRHVAQIGDLALEAVGQRTVAAAHDGVGLDASSAQLGDRVLRGLGLLLAGRADERHERDVEVADVLAADVEAELTDGLEERQDLDVADGATDLGDHDVDLVRCQSVDAPLDLVGDVRDHLHGLAEVVAASFGREYGRVDGAGGGVGVARQTLVDKSLVVAEVEVGLTAVVGDEHLAVLEWVHRARIDVDVRVELLHRDPKPTRLEETTERGSGEALAERGGHSSRYEDVFRHGRPPYRETLTLPVDGAEPSRAARPHAHGRCRCRASPRASGRSRSPGCRPAARARSPWWSCRRRAWSRRSACRRTRPLAEGG